VLQIITAEDVKYAVALSLALLDVGMRAVGITPRTDGCRVGGDRRRTQRTAGHGSGGGQSVPRIHFCPTGGRNPDNFLDFLALPNVVCCGGPWRVPLELVRRGQWDTFSQLAATAMND
jgi:2-keto-3-deoxy-6-phosphogluconate aldolase